MIKKITKAHANRFSNKRHYLIGNGPSCDLIHLQDVSTIETVSFVCNGFVESEHHLGFMPTFYCLADPDYADGTRYSGDLNRFYRSLFSKYPYTTILTSEGIAEYINANFSVNECRCNVLWSPYRPSFQYADKYAVDLDYAIEPFMNVLLLMLQFSFYLGGNNIELHGFDFADIFLVAFMGTESRYFYNANNAVRSNCTDLEAPDSVESLLNSFRGNLVLAEQLYRAKQTASERGIAIKNSSPTTLLPPICGLS